MAPGEIITQIRVERGGGGYKFSHYTASRRLEDSRAELPLVVRDAARERRSMQSHHEGRHELIEEESAKNRNSIEVFLDSVN